MLKNIFRNRKGQGLVEYALIVGGVAITCALAITVFGMKTSDMLGSYASLLPGSSADINQDIIQAGLFEVTNNAGTLQLDMAEIHAENGTTRLNSTLQPATADFELYVIETRVD